jgi:hypothetical protein
VQNLSGKDWREESFLSVQRDRGTMKHPGRFCRLFMELTKTSIKFDDV